MKFMKKIACVCFFLLLIDFPFFSFGKKDSNQEKASENPAETQVKLQKEFIKIDFQLDTVNENPKNRFNWKTKSLSHKDYFDAVSGASKFHSTKKFREFASTVPIASSSTSSSNSPGKLLLIPKGLRNLLLFSVSKYEYLATDSFNANYDESGKLTINFTHRGTKYRIETDENGILHVPESFFIQNLAEKVENPDNPENSSETAGAEPNQDTSVNPDEKEPEPSGNNEENFLPDIPDESLKATYRGELKAVLSQDGILKISGRLKIKPVEPEKSEEPETEIAEKDLGTESSKEATAQSDENQTEPNSELSEKQSQP